jgi:hypothetical protein
MVDLRIVRYKNKDVLQYRGYGSRWHDVPVVSADDIDSSDGCAHDWNYVDGLPTHCRHCCKPYKD